jgi:hypothetical protein
MSSSSTLIWLVMIAGLALELLFSVMGTLLLSEVGPAPLIVGLIFLNAGGGSLFTRYRG